MSRRSINIAANPGPPKIDRDIQDAVSGMLDSQDLKAIAQHLRTVCPPDERVIKWLISRLDAPARSPRLVVKQPVGRPKQIDSQTNLLLGSKVARKREEFGKLEAALHHFQVQNDDWPNPVKRSKALRCYNAYVDLMKTY